MAAEAAAPAAPPAETAKKKGGLPMTAIIIAGVTLVEAVGFFLAFKFLGGGPQPAHGETKPSIVHGEEPKKEHAETVEMELLKKFWVPNSRRGTQWVYDFDLAVKVSATKEEKMSELLEKKRSEISDQIAAIVRSLDPQYLDEPDLKTFRIQVQRAINEIADDPDLVHSVLVPRCVPMRSG